MSDSRRAKQAHSAGPQGEIIGLDEHRHWLFRGREFGDEEVVGISQRGVVTVPTQDKQFVPDLALYLCSRYDYR